MFTHEMTYTWALIAALVVTVVTTMAALCNAMDPGALQVIQLFQG